MAHREYLDSTVFDQAVERLVALYEKGHRLIVSFSAGKDSTCVLETAIYAASLTGRLPVEVVMRDEEINFPGTYEYAQRTAQRPEVSFTWLVARQPMINIFNRRKPYFWAFDDRLDPSMWVREPPWDDKECNVTEIDEINIEQMTIPKRFPVSDGQALHAVIGLRVQESMGRLYGLFQSRGYVTKPNKFGVPSVRPIYDWSDSDVWKAIRDNGWDYNKAYTPLMQMGIRRSRLRIAPPTMNAAGVETLQTAAKIWPQWFDRVCRRLPGVRQAASFGMRAINPIRRTGESWADCFHRECTGPKTPNWIKERAQKLEERMLRAHGHHSASPFPEVSPCRGCLGNIGSWKAMTETMYRGDPFCVKARILPYVEPSVFRSGARSWEGTPSF